MTLEITDSTIYKAEHINGKGESVTYYSACVFYRQNNYHYGIDSDWIAAIDGKLMTETDCYLGYHDEYYLEDFPLEEIHKYIDISMVNNYYSDEDKRVIYQIFTEQLSTVLVGYEKELDTIFRNSI